MELGGLVWPDGRQAQGGSGHSRRSSSLTGGSLVGVCSALGAVPLSQQQQLLAQQLLVQQVNPACVRILSHQLGASCA